MFVNASFAVDDFQWSICLMIFSIGALFRTAMFLMTCSRHHALSPGLLWACLTWQCSLSPVIS